MRGQQLTIKKGWTPEASYVRGQPGALVLTHVHGYGTGVFQRFTTWYRISEDKLNTLFSYPYKFYVVGYLMPLRRDLTSQIIRMPERLARGEKLGLHFRIDYIIQSDDGDAEDALISSDATCFLEWNEEFRTFLPCTPQDDFVNVDELWLERDSAIISRHVDQLMGLIREGSSRQREFIKEHLIPNAPVAERAKLLHAFDGLASKSAPSRNNSP